MRKFLLLPLLGAALLFGGCNLPGENNIVYVDVQKVYSVPRLPRRPKSI